MRDNPKEYIIQQRTEQGWEEVHSEETKEEALQRLKEYRENQPEYPVRMIVRRTKENLSLPRFAVAMEGRHASIHTVGIVTNVNPNAELAMGRPPIFTKLFEGWIRQLGLGFTHIRGKFGGQWENSYLIQNIKRDDLIALGRDAYQTSVIWGVKDDGMEFQYIEYSDAEADYVTSQIRNVWFFGDQSIDDMFSEVRSRKWHIPFFDDSFEGVRTLPGKFVPLSLNPAASLDDEAIATAEFFGHHPSKIMSSASGFYGMKCVNCDMRGIVNEHQHHVRGNLFSKPCPMSSSSMVEDSRRWMQNPHKKELTVFDKHRLNIARKTLKMNSVMLGMMGGMSKGEALELLRELAPYKEYQAALSLFNDENIKRRSEK